jgi:uncharacterized repeat protein (TIGR03803 family)
MLGLASFWLLTSAAATTSLVTFPAYSRQLTTLHAFTANPDGSIPLGVLTDIGGTLYGTTLEGGTYNGVCPGGGAPDHGCGTIFSVNPTTGAENVIYRFSGTGDGAGPYAGLLYHNGLLYGTTIGGGNGLGTIYSFDPVSNVETPLYSFASFATGAVPTGALIYVNGSLYGTTNFGGSSDLGAVFEFNLSTRKETVLHSFTGGADGACPTSALMYQNAAFYGTTAGVAGSCSGNGTVFKIDAKTHHETILHTFTGQADGGGPVGALTYSAGSLYGTTTQGGLFDGACKVGKTDVGCGLVFSINPASGDETVIYDFMGNSDGAGPVGALVLFAGSFFGTTLQGTSSLACIDPKYGCGSVFKVTPASGTESVVYRFTGKADGAAPFAGIIYRSGLFYGPTASGGAGFGSVFRLRP